MKKPLAMANGSKTHLTAIDRSDKKLHFYTELLGQLRHPEPGCTQNGGLSVYFKLPAWQSRGRDPGPWFYSGRLADPACRSIHLQRHTGRRANFQQTNRDP